MNRLAMLGKLAKKLGLIAMITILLTLGLSTLCFIIPTNASKKSSTSIERPLEQETDLWTVKVIDEATQPITQAIIYYNGTLLTNGEGDAQLTDPAGLVKLDNPTPGQPLVALAQVAEQSTGRAGHDGWAYRTHITSLNLDNQGVPRPDVIGDLEQQTIIVRADDPLILFNFVVSLEWDADELYMQTISNAFRLANDYLYDVTDGQMAFGQVNIYDNGEFWAEADVQFSVKNTIRPYAFIGGIASNDPNHSIRVGRFWSGDSANEGAWDQPAGYRTLIHQFGHYALYLYDEYFVRIVDNNGNLIREVPAACTNQDKVGPPATPDRDNPENASIMYFHYNASELADDDRWNEDCQNTEQHRVNGKSDWQTVVDHYNSATVTLNTPTSRGSVMAGPEMFPSDLLPFPEIVIHNAGEADLQTLQLTVLDINGQPVSNVLVTLFHTYNDDTIAIDQGLTNAQGQITIYGAVPGDTIRVSALDGTATGTIMVGSETSYILQLSLSNVTYLPFIVK
jgi:hypothetical protein